MKTRLLNISCIIAMICMFGITSNAQKRDVPILNYGVGPVIAGSIEASALPDSARKFINEHFAGVPIVKCQKEFSSSEYDVEFSDGVEIEFNAKGDWIEIESGNFSTLKPLIIKAVIPATAYLWLEEQKVTNLVESIKHGKSGYKVELEGVEFDDYRFNETGKLLNISD